jgi:hypothetical protein
MYLHFNLFLAVYKTIMATDQNQQTLASLINTAQTAFQNKVVQDNQTINTIKTNEDTQSDALQKLINMSASNYSSQDLANAQQQVQQSMQQMSGETNPGLTAIYSNLMKQMSCDSACQKRTNIDNLRKQWQAAETAQKSAPTTTSVAEKNYLVATDGILGYNQKMITRYTGIAKHAKNNAMENHKEVMREIKGLNSTYEAETLSLDRIKDLLRIRLTENSTMTEDIDVDTATVQTSDRKVVYEEWAKNWLFTVGNILRILYFLVAIIYLYMSPFIKLSEWKTPKGWISPIVLAIFPFFIYYIVLLLRECYVKIVWYMNNKASKNVYTNL